MSSLSDRDKEVLAHMELEFTKEDPKFAQTMTKEHVGGYTSRRIVLGVFGMLVGISVILGALVSNLLPVAILGFAVMIASGMYAFTKDRISNSPRKKAQSDFMKNLEDKWERRREQENNQ